MMKPLRALSVRQPWALAIALGMKTVENRVQESSAVSQGRALVGQRIAIHASRTSATTVRGMLFSLWLHRIWTDTTFADLDEAAGECERTTGMIVAAGTLDRIITHGDGDPMNGDRWRTEDACGLVLRDVVRLAKPVACRGMLGFWTVPVVPADLVRAQLERSTR